MKYFVNNGTTNLGPFSFEEILTKVKAGELKTSYTVFMHEEGNWIPIQQHPEFVKFNLSQNKQYKVELPPLPVTKKQEPVEAVAKTSAPASSGIGDWYILKNGERKGPFAFIEVVKQLQEKACFEYDYAWRQGLENWTRLAEISDFHPENIRRLMKSDVTKGQDVFFRRKHARVGYECPIIAHDNKSFWSGYTIEIGEDGAGIVIENAMLMPGQNVYLHFKAGPQTKAFNVLCEIVSKKYIKNVRNVYTPMIYGVKFINIPKQEKDLIKSLSA